MFFSTSYHATFWLSWPPLPPRCINLLHFTSWLGPACAMRPVPHCNSSPCPTCTFCLWYHNHSCHPYSIPIVVLTAAVAILHEYLCLYLQFLYVSHHCFNFTPMTSLHPNALPMVSVAPLPTFLSHMPNMAWFHLPNTEVHQLIVGIAPGFLSSWCCPMRWCYGFIIGVRFSSGVYVNHVCIRHCGLYQCQLWYFYASINGMWYRQSR